MKKPWKSNSQVDLGGIFSFLKVMAEEQRNQRRDLREIKKLLDSNLSAESQFESEDQIDSNPEEPSE